MYRNIKSYINWTDVMAGKTAIVSYKNWNVIWIADASNFQETVSDIDFTTCTSQDIIDEWWQYFNQNYWMALSTGVWLHYYDNTTDKLAAIEKTIWSSLVGRKIEYEIEWNVWYYRRWWWLDFWIRMPWRNSSGDAYPEASWISIAQFPVYANGQYQWMWTWVIWIYENWWTTVIAWDQSQTVYMNEYWSGNINLWLPITTWIWKAVWTYNFATMTHDVVFSVNDTSVTFQRTFSNITSAEKEKINNFLSDTSVIIYINNWRWYWNTQYDVNFLRKFKFVIK